MKEMKWLLVLLCSTLLVFQPAFGTPPPSPLGTVSGRGPIQLNGVAVPAGTDIYPGSRIATGQQAAGYISLASGGKLVLGGSTLARVRVAPAGHGITVDLNQGVVGAVSDPKMPITVVADGVTVRTKQAGGAYEVELDGHSLRVLARRGTALAAASNRTEVVGAGKLLKATVSPAPQSSRKKKAALVLLTGAAIVGAGLGVALAYPSKTCHSVSPSGFTCH
jgi:hypothetical protein